MIAIALAMLLQDVAKTEELFPQKEGTRWVYMSGANEATVTIAGRQKVGDVECVVVQTERKGAIMKEFVRVTAEAVLLYRVEQAKSTEEYATPLPRLKGGTKKGDAWEWKGRLGGQDVIAKYANEGSTEVTVAAGKFQAWKVTVTMGVAGGTIAQSAWYAPGVGLVLQENEFTAGDQKKTSRVELKSHEAPK